MAGKKPTEKGLHLPPWGRVSELVDRMDIKMLAHSDHAMIQMSIRNSNIRRGPGLWRFDPVLLGQEEFRIKMSKFLKE